MSWFKRLAHIETDEEKIARWKLQQVNGLGKKAWDFDQCGRCCQSRLFHSHYRGDVTTGKACPVFLDSGKHRFSSLYSWRANRKILDNSMTYNPATDPYPPPQSEIDKAGKCR